jgi:hypothetical protein
VKGYPDTPGLCLDTPDIPDRDPKTPPLVKGYPNTLGIYPDTLDIIPGHSGQRPGDSGFGRDTLKILFSSGFCGLQVFVWVFLEH